MTGEFKKRIRKTLKENLMYRTSLTAVYKDDISDSDRLRAELFKIPEEFKKEFQQLWDSQLVDAKWHKALKELVEKWFGGSSS